MIQEIEQISRTMILKGVGRLKLELVKNDLGNTAIYQKLYNSYGDHPQYDIKKLVDKIAEEMFEFMDYSMPQILYNTGITICLVNPTLIWGYGPEFLFRWHNLTFDILQKMMEQTNGIETPTADGFTPFAKGMSVEKVKTLENLQTLTVEFYKNPDENLNEVLNELQEELNGHLQLEKSSSENFNIQTVRAECDSEIESITNGNVPQGYENVLEEDRLVFRRKFLVMAIGYTARFIISQTGLIV